MTPEVKKELERISGVATQHIHAGNRQALVGLAERLCEILARHAESEAADQCALGALNSYVFTSAWARERWQSATRGAAYIAPPATFIPTSLIARAGRRGP